MSDDFKSYKAMGMKDKTTVIKKLLILEKHIRLSAYLKWEKAGKPPFKDKEFWLQAEHELVQHYSDILDMKYNEKNQTTSIRNK